MPTAAAFVEDLRTTIAAGRETPAFCRRKAAAKSIAIVASSMSRLCSSGLPR